MEQQKFKNLGEKIKYYRVQKDISQTDLANTLQSQQAVISQFEGNKRMPSEEVLSNMYKTLNMPGDYKEDKKLFETSTVQTQKSWNDQLVGWYNTEGKKKYGSKSDVAKAIGVPSTTFRDWMSGQSANMDKITAARRASVYDITGLECFSFKGIEKYLEGKAAERIVVPPSESIKIPPAKPIKKTTHGIDDKVLSEFSKASLALSQIERYVKEAAGEEALGKAKAEYHTDRIMLLLEELAEEVNYFRTAPKPEIDTLIKRLKDNHEDFNYVTKMINVFYQGDNAEEWLKLAQPPHQIRRIKK